jgi:hypothetical protein
LWDSHAINVYLVSKYAKNDNLYPKDLKKRALVDQRLHFDTGVAFARGLPIVVSTFVINIVSTGVMMFNLGGYSSRRQNQSRRQREGEHKPGVRVLGGLPRR